MASTNDVVILDRGNNTTCAINLHGATVTSWKFKNKEQLFSSFQAVYDGKKAITGGVLFVFSQFGEWTFGPEHSFARIMRWNIENVPERLTNGDIQATFSIVDDDFTRSMWNFQFKITYQIILRKTELQFNVVVDNPSKDFTCRFNLALHTYFKVPDVTLCKIIGLQSCSFTDKTRPQTGLFEEVYKEDRDAVTIEEWTERTYRNTSEEHLITNVMAGRKMRILKFNFPDTVIWNPWSDRSKKMKDFGDEEYRYMVCVEAAHIVRPVILFPGTSYKAGQILQVVEF